MAISEQIKVLCVRSDISVAELTRRIGTTPQDLLEMTCLSVEEPFWFAEGRLVSPLSAPLKHVFVAERDENDPEQRLGTVLNVILAEFEKLGYKTVCGGKVGFYRSIVRCSFSTFQPLP